MGNIPYGHPEERENPPLGLRPCSPPRLHRPDFGCSFTALSARRLPRAPHVSQAPCLAGCPTPLPRIPPQNDWNYCQNYCNPTKRCRVSRDARPRPPASLLPLKTKRRPGKGIKSGVFIPFSLQNDSWRDCRGPAGIPGVLLGSHGPGWDRRGPAGILGVLLGSLGSCWDPASPAGILGVLLGSHGPGWDPGGPAGIVGVLLGSWGSCWDGSGPG